MPIPFERRSDPIRQSQWIEHLDPTTLRPYRGNARTHSALQIERLAASIARFSFVVPVLIDGNGEIIAGHARVEAAKQLGLERVPCIRVRHLSRAEQRAYRVADNRLAELASWDNDILAKELRELGALNLDFSLEITGFDTAEINFLIEGGEKKRATDPADEIPALVAHTPTVTRPGDLWILGKHRLLCGDARQRSSFERLLGSDKAQLVFAEPPYTMPGQGRTSGLGQLPGSEVTSADGGRRGAEYERFLRSICANLIEFTVDGAIHFICTDWRHARAVLSAGEHLYSELKNICVWNKGDAGGMDSLYRSAHELILVWKAGTASHIDNIKRGRSGLGRSNLWHHAGADSDLTRLEDERAIRSAVKPVALVADALRDCSKLGGLVLDPFAGFGTTLIAVEKSGRRAAGIELDPVRVEVAVRRWQDYTGGSAIHLGLSETFAETDRQYQARRGAVPSNDHEPS